MVRQYGKQVALWTKYWTYIIIVTGNTRTVICCNQKRYIAKGKCIKRKTRKLYWYICFHSLLMSLVFYVYVHQHKKRADLCVSLSKKYTCLPCRGNDRIMVTRNNFGIRRHVPLLHWLWVVQEQLGKNYSVFKFLIIILQICSISVDTYFYFSESCMENYYPFWQRGLKYVSKIHENVW